MQQSSSHKTGSKMMRALCKTFPVDEQGLSPACLTQRNLSAGPRRGPAVCALQPPPCRSFGRRADAAVESPGAEAATAHPASASADPPAISAVCSKSLKMCSPALMAYNKKVINKQEDVKMHMITPTQVCDPLCSAGKQARTLCTVDA